MAKIITYDLCKPETSQDYKTLIAEIQKFDRWCRVTESCWVINTSLTCAQVRDYLRQFIDGNDKLFVAALTGETAWTKIKCKEDYLKVSLGKPG